jgi:hypothetical protein
VEQPGHVGHEEDPEHRHHRVERTRREREVAHVAELQIDVGEPGGVDPLACAGQHRVAQVDAEHVTRRANGVGRREHRVAGATRDVETRAGTSEALHRELAETREEHRASESQSGAASKLA